MSAQTKGVDVLAVIADAATWVGPDAKALKSARAAVAELIEAATAYAEAEEALGNRELNGINAEPHDKLQSRVHAARRDLDAALARVQGGA